MLFSLIVVAFPLLILSFCSDWLWQIFRNKLEFFAAAKVSSSFPTPNLPEIAFAGMVLRHHHLTLLFCTFVFFVYVNCIMVFFFLLSNCIMVLLHLWYCCIYLVEALYFIIITLFLVSLSLAHRLLKWDVNSRPLTHQIRAWEIFQDHLQQQRDPMRSLSRRLPPSGNLQSSWGYTLMQTRQQLSINL